MKDLLLEIGCENLPPASIRAAFEQLKSDAARKLEDLRLPFADIYATGAPRRLVLIVRGLAPEQTAKTELITGPPVSKAYDESGSPTPTAVGFARSHGIEAGKLERVRTERGEYVGFTKELTRSKAQPLLREALPALVTGLKFPKMMRWEKSGARFARPIRWIVCLYGDAVLPIEIAGVKSARTTFVEPWLDPKGRAVENAGHYLAEIRKAGVLIDHEERRGSIETLARGAAKKRGMELIEDPSLVEELTFMLESPHVLVGEFDESYLALPPEVVTTAMKAHQRYLAVRTESKKLVPMFVTFTEGRPGAPGVVRHGNERVLRARLEDALFYWKEDLHTGLEGLSRKLGAIVFIEGLGTLEDKAKRLHALSLAANGMRPAEQRVGEDLIRRAAALAKADLASEMVKDGKEFTLLEGLIGSHYARHAEEEKSVVTAIREHYLPRYPSDPIPRTPLGTLLGIADRLDTVSGCFLAGLIPTGSQDPYALRRQAAGLVRILERLPDVSVRPLVRTAVDAYVEMGLGGKRDKTQVTSEIEEFFRARVETFLRDQGIAHDAVSAVCGASWSNPGVALQRAKAIEHLRGDRAFELLVTGAKRVGNILAKDVKTLGTAWETLEKVWIGGEALPGGSRVDPKLFDDDAEKLLDREIKSAIPTLVSAESRSDYAMVYRLLSALGPAIDRYFESVLVNCPDPTLRQNRHAFLCAVHALFSKYADFSRIVEPGKSAVS
jgi:glycyl-tRNA synthetase beta chain